MFFNIRLLASSEKSKATIIEHSVEIVSGMVFALETCAGDGYDGVRPEDEMLVCETGIDSSPGSPQTNCMAAG